jgi:hypothetical protein
MDCAMKHLRLIIVVSALVASLSSSFWVGDVSGGEMTDDMKKMQEELNKGVLSKPFSVADEARVKAYIEDAQRRGEVPPSYTGKHWKPGYTCVDLRRYSYQEYLACRYYYSYYGYYYR